jgi:hypothetical protein
MRVRFPRILFALTLATFCLLLAASTALAAKPDKYQVSVSDTYDFTGVCTFSVTVNANADIMAIHYVDQSGALTRIFNHVNEHDIFSANGKTLVGLPFSSNIEARFDSAGNMTSLTGTGIVERVPLPDGSVFQSSGRVDFLAHPDSNFILTPDHGHSGNVAAFCAALS